MATPLVSFLIPSRRGFNGLLAAVASLRAHPDSEHFEIRVWLDDDDKGSLHRVTELESFNIKLHIGARDAGYNSTGQFCSRMAEASQCPWVCICDDDNRINDVPFIDQLRALPTTGVLAFPEIYKINECEYLKHHQYAFIPNGAWKVVQPDIGQPTDTWMHEILVTERKWRVHKFKGLLMHHIWTPRTDLS